MKNKEKIMNEILDRLHDFSMLRKQEEDIRLAKEEARQKILHGLTQLRWVPVEEREPDEWTCALVTTVDDSGRKMVMESCYEKGHGWFVASGMRVTAWMDLPSAYEEG